MQSERLARWIDECIKTKKQKKMLSSAPTGKVSGKKPYKDNLYAWKWRKNADSFSNGTLKRKRNEADSN